MAPSIRACAALLALLCLSAATGGMARRLTHAGMDHDGAMDDHADGAQVLVMDGSTSAPMAGMDMGGTDGGMDMGGTDGGMDMGGMDMGGTDGGMATLTGSKAMDDPCYTTPSDEACAGFNRTDADWTADLTLLCDAMPFMVGCALWEQCKAGTASGPYCSVASLTGDVCADMPKMKGCEAYNALCSNGTVVEQCYSPGPIPDVVTTFTVKEGLESLCDTHCMAGCGACGKSGDWATCTDPLGVLARMCYEMAMMPECSATGFAAMCEQPDVADTFPLVCTEPAAVPDDCT